jgi:hypothetical protein
MGKLKSKRQTPRLCYLCGAVGANSRDHVVAAGFFSQPYPPNLVTLPAHHNCQAQYSDSEDYVRNILAGLASGGSDKEAAPGETATRAFQRNSVLRTEIAQGLIAAEEVYTNVGIYIGTSPALKFDPGRFFASP